MKIILNEYWSRLGEIGLSQQSFSLSLHISKFQTSLSLALKLITNVELSLFDAINSERL